MSETPQQPVALKTLQPSSSGRDLVGKSRMKTGEKLKGLSNSGNGVGNAKLTSYFNQEKSDDKLKAAIKTTKDVEIQTDQSLEIENSILRHTGNTQWKSADKAECSRCARSNVVQMLIGSAPNEKYWELVAEERRIALQESLRENMQIYEEIAALREENRQLRFLADEGTKYAEILKELVNEQNSD